MKKTPAQSGSSSVDYEQLEERIDKLWNFLETKKYHAVCDHCKDILDVIERDLGGDFGQDLDSATLYDDTHEVRRERYLEVLQVYNNALRSLVIELLLKTIDIKDIDPNFTRYQSLRHEIEAEISTVAYLLGQQYEGDIFLTRSDLEELDRQMQDHCRFILKSEFFKRFKLVIQELGSLDRKNFHKVTEPYKNLRNLCQQCLQILDVMRDGRFFGSYDTFIEDYEKDVHIYLQILWYLAIKTDLNKTDKFLNPNTYNEGLDEHCQVFAALALLEEIIPHVEQARNVGLSDQATTELLEEYTEYFYTIVTHEERNVEQERAKRLSKTKKLEMLKSMQEIIERHTINQEKTKYRLDFAIKWFKKTRFAFKLGGHKRIAVPNPEGRVLRSTTSIDQIIDALKTPIFATFFEELNMRYRSRVGLKLQKLRWSWFAERELKAGYFEKPKYNYLNYIHSRWKEKVQDHYKTLHKLSQREED